MDIYRKSFIIFSLLYILFFTKTWASMTGNVYIHDDLVYYAQTASLVNDGDIDITNNISEEVLDLSPVTEKKMSYQPIGTSLFYILPYAISKPVVCFISYLRGVPFNEYDPLFFVVLCFYTLILFYYAGLFLKRALSAFFDSAIAGITTIFVLWGTILPVFVFRRPIFSVIPEFFLMTALVCLVSLLYKKSKITFLKTLGIGAMVGFLVATRWNDAYILLFSMAILAHIAGRSEKGMAAAGRIAAHWFVFSLAFIVFLYFTQIVAWQVMYGGVKDFAAFYKGLHTSYVNSGIPLRELSLFKRYIWNFLYILFGKDWGLLYTMPILLIGALPLVFNRKLTVSRNRILQASVFLTTLSFPFYLTLKWKNTAGYFGYRLLLSLLPLTALGFAYFIERFWPRHKALISRLIICFCVFNFFIILPFELTESTTMHYPNITPMGGGGWGNNAYFVNAAVFYFKSDLKTLITNFSRGYLGAFTFGVFSLMHVDLVEFGPKVKEYFTLAGYRQHAALVYFFLSAAFFYFIGRKRIPPAAGKEKIEGKG